MRRSAAASIPFEESRTLELKKVVFARRKGLDTDSLISFHPSSRT
jgi:hypothetical protein